MDSSSNDTPHTSLENADEHIIDPSHSSTPEVQEPAEPLNEFDRADAEVASRFQDGQVLRFIRVRFPGHNRPMSFYIADKDFHYGQKVVAMSERGIAVGFVNSFAFEMKFHKGLLPIRSIVKIATPEDYLSDEETFRQERRLRDVVERLVDKNQLDMHITQVEITQLGKKAVFYFTAPTRIDFRGLVHEIVGELKMRIELRQISVRDRSASVGGLGPCGRELCCSSFLAKYGNVGIKLAKNQDLSLNSSKINGVCGQLKCCLTYEDEVYQEKRKKMPRENALIKTKDGQRGKVIRLHILSEQFETISPEGIIRRYVAEMWDGLAEGLEIPKFFENGVTDLSKTVLGMDQVLARKAEEHEEHVKIAKREAKDYADQIFEQLFGAKSLDWALPDVAEPNSTQKKLVVPEEEEEIVYVAPSDELLDDDESEDDESESEMDDQEDAIESDAALPQSSQIRQEHRPDYHASPRHPRPDHRRDRDTNKSVNFDPRVHQPRPGDSRQERAPQDRGPRPDNRNQQQRPPQQGQRPQGDGLGPEGGGGQRRRSRGGRGRRGGNGGGNGPNGGGGQRPPQG